MKDNISSCITVTFEPINVLPQNIAEFLDSYFEVSALNFTDDNKDQYVGYAPLSFDEEDLLKAAKKAGISLPSYKIDVLKNKNWLTENVIKFAPQKVADFCVYGIHEKKAPKTKKIPIQVYAATAFGSTHPTTHMCLTALSDLSHSSFRPKNIIDVGTGSGVLSIAAAKKWSKLKPHILGVDIDIESVNVAAQNAYDNNIQDLMDVSYSNGFKAKAVKKNAPYDLVFANILARPLILMAKDMAKSLKPQGYAVLSGFTDAQTDWVLGAFQKVGFKLTKLYKNEHWRAALIQKKQNLMQIQSDLKRGESILIKRDNMFLGEDILFNENIISELSGFTGSAGMMLVAKDKAFLLVDGRYSIQARKETSKNIEVIDTQNFYTDLLRLIKENNFQKLLFNPWVVSKLETKLFENHGINLIPSFDVPMSGLTPPQKVFKHPQKFAGLSSKEKCTAVVKAFPKGFDALLITSAAELSWLSNLRAFDLPDTPVLRAYGLLKKDGSLKVYSFEKISTLIKDLKKCAKIIYNAAQTPLALFKEASNLEDINFTALSNLKLQKNPVELKGFINAHIKDGVALVKFFCWLEKNYQGLSELDVVQKLHEFRTCGKYYFSESFGTIAAIGSNAAIVHYQPSSKTNKKFSKSALLLLDSGAQYFDGTTDITRTVGFGHIKNEIKKDFTLVLKAHIALASHIFKKGTPANELDAVCRNVLLQQGKDFKHGTGHSVGHFSNVHEPPFSINQHNTTPVLESYITSIEPGYYLENAYGIRIENLVYTKPDQKKGYLCFEPLTLCPIDLNLIKPELLTESEKSWLNQYHQRVFETLHPLLNKQERVWLENKCRLI